MMGYFVEKKMAFGPINKKAMEMWETLRLVEVKVHEDFFFFRFDDEEGFNNVLNNGPWKFFNQYIFLKECSIEFDNNK